jgi:hypothetical protein
MIRPDGGRMHGCGTVRRFESRGGIMTTNVLKVAGIGFCFAAVACETSTGSPSGPTPIAGGATAQVAEPVAVVRLTDFAEVGSSRVIRTPNGINFTLATSDLKAGHAHTLWVVVFNEPAHCAVPNACAPDDVVNAAAKPDLIWGAGRIEGSGGGTATFSGHRAVGDTSDSINGPVGLPAYGLIDAFKAEIHLAVHDHGPKLAEYLPDMIKTIDGGCTDAGVPVAGVMSPWNSHPFGRRGPNTCMTIQAAVHRP